MKNRYKIAISMIIAIISILLLKHFISTDNWQMIICVPILWFACICLFIGAFADAISKRIENLKK